MIAPLPRDTARRNLEHDAKTLRCLLRAVVADPNGRTLAADDLDDEIYAVTRSLAHWGRVLLREEAS
jgi:hypothetical protein